ncbi:hypothetical protein Sru01_55440 [Sphaerisporangium rufum]|uniref:Uncharacterized protein n=1 Tax=Sphaerisporangium rufum TaxID=1381558 RepID=A0A919V394_9ACTN|nr:hypothetical protein [Sphaerisporangium rufum]GII80562.1 hypothetical protein Sru01_55440 [Sphaerisporangium rufum]
MSMFTRYTPAARAAVVRAGLLSLAAGRHVLDEDAVLVALAETRPFDRPLAAFEVSVAAVHAAVLPGGAADAALLATLGIDLAEVRRRMPRPVDDPARWELRRSRSRPLRVTLRGPAAALRLTARARKVVEVARHRPGPDGRVTGEALLRGLLADGSNRSVRVLAGLGVPLRPLAAELDCLRHAA